MYSIVHYVKFVRYSAVCAVASRLGWLHFSVLCTGKDAITCLRPEQVTDIHILYKQQMKVQKCRSFWGIVYLLGRVSFLSNVYLTRSCQWIFSCKCAYFSLVYGHWVAFSFDESFVICSHIEGNKKNKNNIGIFKRGLKQIAVMEH